MASTTTEFHTKSFLNKLNPVVVDYRYNLLARGEKKYDSKVKASQIFGYGIAKKSKEFVEFGNLILDLPKLQDQNKLRVLYPNHINVKEIKTTAVSQNFDSLITSLLETNKFNHSLFDLLDKGEQDLMILLFQRAGLHSYIKDVKTKRHKDVDKLVKEDKNEHYQVNNPSGVYGFAYKLPKETLDRWEVVKGSILAGNDNRNLVKEAINIVNTFKSTGHCSKQEADEQIDYLKSLL